MTPKLPGYLKQILEMQARGELAGASGETSHITVSHDDWCMVWNGGACNCEPAICPGLPEPGSERPPARNASAPEPNRAQRRAKRRP